MKLLVVIVAIVIVILLIIALISLLKELREYLKIRKDGYVSDCQNNDIDDDCFHDDF